MGFKINKKLIRREKRTDSDSEVSDLGNILRTSRKLAAAKNFFAVDLYIFKLLVRDKESWDSSTPSSMSVAIFVVGTCKDFESKVFYICKTSQFIVNRIVRSDLILCLF